MLTFRAGAFPNLVTVAHSFAWAENMFCVNASLYVTENRRGEIYKVDWNGTAYMQRKLKISDAFELFAGLAVLDHELFALGNLKNANSCTLVRVDVEEKEDDDPYDIVATLPRKCLGDGLAVYNRTFFTASEGDFIPLNGRVYSVDADTGMVKTLVTDGLADDGVAADEQRGIVYVSEAASPSHRILAINASTSKIIRKVELEESILHMIDDFTVETSSGRIVAADFLGGTVVRFDGLSEDNRQIPVTVLANGLKNPTSARFGCVHDNSTVGFSDRLVFVSEGGGLTGATTNRRVLAFLYA